VSMKANGKSSRLMTLTADGDDTASGLKGGPKMREHILASPGR
jgi:hypothetical protein